MMSWAIWTHTYVENPAIDMAFGMMRRNPTKRAAVVGENIKKLERPVAAVERWLAGGREYLVGGLLTHTGAPRVARGSLETDGECG